ncbi:MAG: hypothetical protein LBQ77_02760 [Treponema sp.]|jgi:hypothetical protein|nr:hypothetical protein [Treponema sp.]
MAWQCTHCETENNDNITRCEVCGNAFVQNYKNKYEEIEILNQEIKILKSEKEQLNRDINRLQTVYNNILNKFAVEITSIYIGNLNVKGKWIHKPGEKLNASEVRYLKIIMIYSSRINKNITLYIKLIDPGGGLICHPLISPSGYSFSETKNVNLGKNLCWDFKGCGNANISIYRRGDYRVEIWHEALFLSSTIITLY